MLVFLQNYQNVSVELGGHSGDWGAAWPLSFQSLDFLRVAGVPAPGAAVQISLSFCFKHTAAIVRGRRSDNQEESREGGKPQLWQGQSRGHSHWGHGVYGQGCLQRSAPREVCLFHGNAEISAVGREKGQHHAMRVLVQPHLIFTGTQCASTALSFMRGQLVTYYLALISGGVRIQSLGHQTQIHAPSLTCTAWFVAVGPEHRTVGQAGTGLFQCKALCQLLSLPLVLLLRSVTEDGVRVLWGPWRKSQEPGEFRA